MHGDREGLVRKGPDREPRNGFLPDAALIFLLCGVALAQPLYEVLARGAEFFVAHRSRPIDVISMAAVLSFLIPGALVGVEALLGLLNLRARGALHRVIVSLLFSVAFVPLFKRLESGSGWALLTMAVVAGTVCGLSLARWRLLGHRYFQVPATLLAISFPLWFFLATPVRKIVLPNQAVSSADPRLAAELKTPVFLIVLDELASTTLMNENREIDGSLFPSLGRLAADSTWYRNATTVADFTIHAVPAILTGRYPTPKLLPTASDHPDNLFTLLGDLNELIVVERTTELCPKVVCRGGARDEPFWRRLKSLFSDLAVVYGHIVLPVDIAEGMLPPISATWHGFATPASDGVERRSTATVEGGQVEADGRVASFRSFIRSIEETPRPALHYFHAGLPHHPWQYTPTGKRYGFRPARHLHNFAGTQWGSDTWLSIQGFQRHVMQTMFTDRLMGELIDRLKAKDLYDRSMIILTSDHGVSFMPGELRRQLSVTNYKEVMPVPLFVKLPNQKEGSISDRNVELIDILPTVAEAQGVVVPWEMDGQPLGNLSLNPRKEKIIFSEAGEKMSFSASFDEKYEALQWQQSFMATGNAMRLFGISPNSRYGSLVGRQITSLRVSTSGWRGELDTPNLFENVDAQSLVTPTFITGRIYSEEESGKLSLAVAINGTIQSVTRTYFEGTAQRFAAMVPEGALRPGRNVVEVFAIRDEPRGQLQLSRISLGDASYRIEITKDRQTEVIRSADGRIFPVQEHSIDGKIKRGVMKNGAVVLRGWVVGRGELPPPAAILVFEDGVFRFSGTMKHHPRASTATEFRLVVPQETFSDLGSAEMRFFALSDEGYASELPTSVNFPWKKERRGD